LKTIFEKDYNGNFFPRFLKYNGNYSSWFCKQFLKKMHKQGPTGHPNLFTSVFGKQIPTDLIITRRTKPKIL